MTYRDILAKRERKRPDGTPVWPLRPADLPGSFPAEDRASCARVEARLFGESGSIPVDASRVTP